MEGFNTTSLPTFPIIHSEKESESCPLCKLTAAAAEPHKDEEDWRKIKRSIYEAMERNRQSRRDCSLTSEEWESILKPIKNLLSERDERLKRALKECSDKNICRADYIEAFSDITKIVLENLK